MSASSWTSCPRCHLEFEKLVEDTRAQARAAYGVVSPDVWLEMSEAAEHLEWEEGTFREDYEFYGAATGLVTYKYKGCCTRCNLEVSFGGKERFFQA